MTVTPRDITNDAFTTCIELKVAEHQKGFVATNLYSLAEAKADGVSNPYAIYADEQMVGFVMYDFDHEEGCGYGREAMRQVLDRLGAIPECREIHTGHMPGNEAASNLYERFSFVSSSQHPERHPHEWGDISCGGDSASPLA